MLTKMEVGVDEGDIKGAFRLGKCTSEVNTQAVPRPVLVQFHNRTAKKLDNGEFVQTETPGITANVILSFAQTLDQRS